MTFIFAPPTPSTVTASLSTRDSWTVGSTATIIVPSDPNRIRVSVYHEGAGDLLIDFGINNPTLSNFAFPLPPGNLYIESTWRGAIRAISRQGMNINVLVRTFYE